MFSEQRYAARALRAGAVAYLSKERPPPDLIQAVKAALEIGPVKRRVKAAAPQPLLSDREVQVLGLLVNGRTRQQIAEQLHISEKTVSTYRTRLMVKLEPRNLVELIRYAVDEGLVD
jgi:DNA-binding NarL/FixJ family response regulator